MPLTITKLKMWKDPGYTRRCIEAPPVGSKKLPTPDYVLGNDETLRPHKGSTLTNLNLPLSFTQLFGMSYLYIEASDGAGSISLFGWIDSITQRSTSYEGVTVNWSVDWWRSYSGSVTFGAGIIRRCANDTYKRPRTLSPRRRLVSSYNKLFGPRYNTQPNTMWVIMLLDTTIAAYSGDDIVSSYSRIEKIFWPATNNPTIGTNNKHGMAISTCYAGLIDEMITDWMATRGTSPVKYNYQIIAAYATPINPSDGVTWNGSAWISSGGLLDPQVIESSTYAFFFSQYNVDGYTGSSYYRFTPGSTLTADDSHQYVITDFDGNVAVTIPWGTTIKSILVYNDVGVAGGYLKMAILDNTNGVTVYPTLGPEGRIVTIPLPSIPITSNYWSDYILSGQRDFNYANRQLSREEEAWKSGVNETKSAIDKAAGLDFIGAAIGAVTGFSSIGANLIINEEYADKYNKLDDMAASRQKNSIQVSGMSSFWQSMNMSNPNNGVSGPYLMDLVMDSVSAAEYTGEITIMGYETQIPVASASAFITAGGPIQIEQLVLTGNAPPEAKQAIKTLLENGIRITENNPSGVVP